MNDDGNNLGVIFDKASSSADGRITTPIVNLDTTVGSVSLWFNVETSEMGGNPSMLFHGSEASNGDGFGGENEFHLNLNPNGELQAFARGDVNTVTTGTSFDDGAWHHVVLTWDRNATGGDETLTIYADGNRVAGSTGVYREFDFSQVLLGAAGGQTLSRMHVILAAKWTRLRSSTRL